MHGRGTGTVGTGRTDVAHGLLALDVRDVTKRGRSWLGIDRRGRRSLKGGEYVTPPAQGLIGSIGDSYQQIVTSFSEASLERTPRLSVLDLEQFGDG